MPLTDAFRAFRDRYGPFADPGSADLTPPPQDQQHLRDLSDLGAFYRNIAQQLDATPLPMVPQSLLNRESTNVDDRRPWWQRRPPGGNFDYANWRKELDRMLDELDRLQDWSRNR